MKRITVCIVALVLTALTMPLLAVTPSISPKRELRGVWLATVWGIDWPSVRGTSSDVRKRQMEELSSLLDRCEAMNLTTVFFQVRSMGDVMYESRLEPWSAFVSGTRGVSPGWDPLRFAVNECHRRGLECYAWVNPFRWSSGTDYNSAHDKRWKKNGWLLTYGKYTVFNPGIAEVREHVVDICKEIVECYDVDGLVFDDYFYPNRIPETASAPDYKLWQEEAPWMTFGDWRRANIHKTVADVHSMIVDIRPEVRFGISPAGVAAKSNDVAARWGTAPVDVKADDWQYDEIYSEPLAWLYQGTVDFISPQIYWPMSHPTAPYGILAKWWSETAMDYGVHFYSSMTLAPLEKHNTGANRAELISQIGCNRNSAVDDTRGTVLYSAKFIHKLAPDLVKSYFRQKAISPELRRSPNAVAVSDQLCSPRSPKIRGGVLSWEIPENVNDNTAKLRYAVYAFPAQLSLEDVMDSKGDGIKGKYLLRIVYGNEIKVKEPKMRYAVTFLTGTSRESAPVFTD